MINTDGGAWSLGTYFFWPLFVLGVLGLLTCLVLGLIERDAVIAGVGAAVCGSVIAGCLFAYWPITDTAFHKWYPVRGTVASSDSRIITEGKKTTQRFVVRFAESRELFGCDDSRCAAARPGTTLLLRCKRTWQFQATAGWVCNYNQRD